MANKAFPHVKAVKRNDGRFQYYHRVAKIRLPDEYGSPEFAEAWAVAERSIRSGRASRAAPGTFGDLVEAFEASEDWASLAPRTQADYRKARDYLFKLGAARGFTRELEQGRCEKILDAALEETNWRFAVYVLQYGRRVFNWSQEKAARKKRWGEGNPWRDIPTPAKPKALKRRKANRPWKAHEVIAALERAPFGLRRAYVLGACGFDGATMIGLRWADYDEKRGVFADEARTKTGVGGYTIVYGPLRAFLEEGPRPSDYIVTNLLGEPFRVANTLQTRSSEFLIGLAGETGEDGEPIVGEGLTLHGLRHTLGKAAADGGADIRAIQTLLRHSSENMSLYYSRQADGQRAAEAASAAISAFFEEGRGKK